jgi:hypothetical protein
MSIIALHATSQTETDTERAATCFAKGQLRCALSLTVGAFRWALSACQRQSYVL